jgi:hemolysin III
MLSSLAATLEAGGLMQHGERFNTVTHFGGLILTLAGTLALVSKALGTEGGSQALLAVLTFGVTMVLLYAASTLYHAAAHGAAKEAWARADHCAIYLLIAGTYTPFTLITLRGPWGWWLFGAVWALALIGIAKELVLGRQKIPSVPLYLLMGWIGVLAAGPLIERLPAQGAWWLLAGGVLYTVGVLFYAKSDVWRHSHGVWHLFVLGGTAAHFVSVFYYVV